MFPTGEADEMNWCFLSTSGIHGTYRTLDDIEAPDSDDSPSRITVLVVAPRMVRCGYGDIEVAGEDVPWLRRLVESTLSAVAESQRGNLMPEAGV